MNLKTFQADTMHEAMAKVKEDLGPEAIIVRTQQVSRKSLGRNKKGYEVTASDARTSATKDWTGGLPRISLKSIPPTLIAPVPKPMQVASQLGPPKVQEASDMPTRELLGLRKEIHAMLESVRPVSKGGMDLQAIDIPAVSAEALWRRATLKKHPDWDHSPSSRIDILSQLMAKDIRYSGGIRLKAHRPVKVLFIGPSGAGKSSLIQKLAIQGKIRAGKRMGILSTDRKRIGAHEELALFSKTMNLKCARIFSAAEIPEACEGMRDCQMILVDAPYAPKNELDWRELELLCKNLQPDEIHLVLNSCTRERELRKSIETYSRLRPNRLSFTRLDECLGVGGIYVATQHFQGDLAYLVSGPAATEDIETASPMSLADLFARGLYSCSSPALVTPE